MIGMVFDLLDHSFAQKIKVVDCYMTNLQYSVVKIGLKLPKNSKMGDLNYTTCEP